jgi:hypothetical protein
MINRSFHFGYLKLIFYPAKNKKYRNTALNSDYINKISIGTPMAVVRKEAMKKYTSKHRQ